MAVVDLNIGGRKFQLACADGEEQHLTVLASSLNSRIKHLGVVHDGSDQLLLAMTALMMQDELNELGKRTPEASEPTGKNKNVSSQYLSQAVNKINLLSEYMETLAEKLEKC